MQQRLTTDFEWSPTNEHGINKKELLLALLRIVVGLNPWSIFLFISICPLHVATPSICCWRRAEMKKKSMSFSPYRILIWKTFFEWFVNNGIFSILYNNSQLSFESVISLAERQSGITQDKKCGTSGSIIASIVSASISTLSFSFSLSLSSNLKNCLSSIKA